MKTRIHPLVLAVIILGAIGFIVSLVNNPVYVILTIALTVLVVYLISNYLRTGRLLPRFSAPSSSTARPNKTQTKKSSSATRKNIPFTVIEGSKGKSGKSNDKDSKPKIYH
ncbi:hypothetical protein [Brevibacillus dissolubilis]|uniref:hypothetical protein n=1 Tax=Brevibacillus dissolubilis TaxID=1844116 RepID=UPI001117969D|nr:hypothetical protein [Brevibacillus dissolubilis]